MWTCVLGNAMAETQAPRRALARWFELAPSTFALEMGRLRLSGDGVVLFAQRLTLYSGLQRAKDGLGSHVQKTQFRVDRKSVV